MKKFFPIFATLILFGLLFWFNFLDFQQAYNDSVDRGEELRAQLNLYFKANGAYPNSLAELEIKNMPGKRWFGKTIIKYQIRPEGYLLDFGDQMVSWRATESEAFTASK